MAACLITTGGTSGTLRIDFLLGSDPNVVFSTHGDLIYIPDTATDVTYTTLTGDVTAASGCVTITAKPMTYYIVTYDRLIGDASTYDPKFDAVVLDGTDVHPLTPNVSSKNSAAAALVDAINNTLDETNIKIVAYKIALVPGYTNYNNISFIIRIIGDEVPSLRLKTNFNNISYIIGTPSTVLPAGFTEVVVLSEPAP